MISTFYCVLDNPEKLKRDPHSLSRELSQMICKKMAMEQELEKSMQDMKSQLEKQNID